MLQDNVGKKGELLAQHYLRQNNFSIRHTNWRYGNKELDIIATKNNTLHVVEVKTRSTNYWQEPKQAVVLRKQKNILAATQAYIVRENINFDTQFDVISIVMDETNYRLEYIPNAFNASEIE